MIINALLLVQMFHFFVAYLILKHILLKPGLMVIQEEDAYDALLERNNLLGGEEVARQESALSERWQVKRELLQEQVPSVELREQIKFSPPPREEAFRVNDAELVVQFKDRVIKQVTKI
ncbi:MAG: hypothetical protein JW725_04795 [Candidatus Babeliaceae bacterium]|nr:hypothetical protein [Candidatus Babeliaceae bacterium]